MQPRIWQAAILLALVPTPFVAGGEKVTPVNLKELNTAANEVDPCPAPDGNSLLYSVKVKKFYDFYISRRATSTSAFPRGKPFIADRGADIRGPFLFQNTYYFASNEVPDEKFAKLKNFDLFKQIGTQAQLPLLGDINTRADEMYPWITSTGKEFYFSRKTKDGWKLFVANGPVPGPIGKAREVGFPGGFHRATISANGLTMYLQGPLDDGSIGLYRSKRGKAGGDWSEPEQLKALNHPDSDRGDMQPALSLDGTRLYFSSDRPGGKGGFDIWYVLTAQLK